MRSVLPALLAVSLLVGCGPRGEEPENQAQGAPAPGSVAPAPPAPAAAATAKVWFVPAAMEDCSPPVGQIATIHWDASKSSAKIVDVKAIGADGVEGTFATSGPVGSKVTEAWMLPGSVVVVRDHDTGVELGRAVAQSRTCTR